VKTVGDSVRPVATKINNSCINQTFFVISHEKQYFATFLIFTKKLL